MNSLIISQAAFCNKGSQSFIPDKSSFCRISFNPVLTISEVSFNTLDPSRADRLDTISDSVTSASLLTFILGTMLATVTIPISVLGFKFRSLLDYFTTTTSILELPGFNSEVFPRIITVVHLGDNSTST